MAATSTTRRKIQELAFWSAYVRLRYTILFFALLLTLLIVPIASTIGAPTLLIKFLLATCLLAAVMPNANRNTRLILFAGVVLLSAARLASDAGDIPIKSGILMALEGFVGLATAAGALRFVVTTKDVNSQTIYAALSTYLLAGLFFGQLYWSLENLRPGSLVGPDPVTETTSIYYSFVTLATLGYGDYLPRTDIARGVAVFEVIGGQLFLAVMVARLIGLFTPDK